MCASTLWRTHTIETALATSYFGKAAVADDGVEKKKKTTSTATATATEEGDTTARERHETSCGPLQIGMFQCLFLHSLCERPEDRSWRLSLHTQTTTNDPREVRPDLGANRDGQGPREHTARGGLTLSSQATRVSFIGGEIPLSWGRFGKV